MGAEETLHITDHILHTGPDPAVGDCRLNVTLGLSRGLVQSADHKASGVPELVGKVAVGFHLLDRKVGVIPRSGAHQKGEAQRIRAELVHHDERIHHVALGLGHLVTVFIADQTVQIDLGKGDLAGEVNAVHDHAGDPEEQDVITGLQHGGRVKVFIIRGLFRPAKGRERPETGGEPGVQHIRILFDVVAVALRTFMDVRAGDDHLTAILTVPHRDAVSPPELTADAPVLDVFQPVIVNLREVIRDDFDLTGADRFQRGFRQAFHLHEPLLGDHRLDHFAGTLGVRDGHLVGFFLDDQSGFLHVRPDRLAAFEAVHAGILPGFLVHMRIFGHDVDLGQSVCLPNGIVMRVMGRGDLQRTGTEFAIHIFIRDHGDLTADHRDTDRFADVLLITRVFRMDSHGRVTRDGFRTGRGDRQVVTAVIRQHIFEVIQRAGFVFVFHLQVGNGRLQLRRPVDDAGTAVHQPFFIQADECFADGLGETFIQGEAFAIPVTGSAQALDLCHDAVMIFVFPFPNLFQELFPAQVLTVNAFFRQSTFHQHLGGDPRMVGTRNPEGRDTLHAVIADHQVFHGNEHGMAQVQLTGNVRGRDGDHIRLVIRVMVDRIGIIDGFEITLIPPPLIHRFLSVLEIIRLWQLFTHNTPVLGFRCQVSGVRDISPEAYQPSVKNSPDFYKNTGNLIPDI